MVIIRQPLGNLSSSLLSARVIKTENAISDFLVSCDSVLYGYQVCSSLF